MQPTNKTNKQLQFNFSDKHFTEDYYFSTGLREQPINTLLYSGSPKITLLEQPDNCDTALDQVKAFYHLLQLISITGMLEHTSDYDPYLEIILRDGTVINTNNHYFTFEISDSETIILEDYSDLFDDEDDDCYRTYDTELAIKDIQSIQLIQE